MKCNKCGSESPNDSKFCQNCGAPLEEIQEPAPVNQEKINIDPFSQKAFNINSVPENQIPPANDNAGIPKQEFDPAFVNNIPKQEFNAIPPDAPKKKSNSGMIAAIIIVSVLLVVLLAVIIVQAVMARRNKIEISSLEETVDYYSQLIDEMEFDEDGTISELSTEEFCKQVYGYPVGYATENFHANTGLIILSQYETEEFELTAYWPNGGSVFTDWYSGAADVYFTEDTWDTTVTMTVEPYYEGIEIITFTNDVDDSEFKLIIVVTE